MSWNAMNRKTSWRHTCRACVIFLTIGALSGCRSSVHAISEEAAEISQLATSSQSRFAAIADETSDGEATAANLRTICGEAKAGASEQGAIIDSVGGIQNALAGVEDKTPWWARMTGNVALAVLALAAIVLLWQTGIGGLVRRLVYTFSWFIPERASRSAALDAKMLHDDNPATAREVIAARRASDPAYNAAWQNQKGR